MTAARPSTVIVSRRDAEEEFERFAAGLLGAKFQEPDSKDGRSGPGSRGPQPSISAQFIYEYAVELVAREGVDALTVRRLAAELKISTRTLYKRIGSRTNMIRELINLHAARLQLGFQPRDTWEDTTWSWCLQLHQALTAQPHLTHMSQGRTLAAVTSYVNALIEATVREGISQDVAAECWGSLADLTINDALGAARKAVVDKSVPHAAGRSVDLSKTTADAIKWILLGVRTEASTAATGWKRS
jgi:AcrR family transcriptional regulator